MNKDLLDKLIKKGIYLHDTINYNKRIYKNNYRVYSELVEAGYKTTRALGYLELYRVADTRETLKAAHALERLFLQYGL